MSDDIFPQGFLWGAATAAHQIEGDNRANDWWEWEQKGRTHEPSGIACDSYRRYEEDFDLAAAMHHNAHRFSVEWSRIQPEEGCWDEEALRHYQQVLKALVRRGIQPLVTLHHFTLPLWFSKIGGWEHPKAAAYFEAYARTVARALGPDVRFWMTFNELNVFTYKGYLEGHWPPGKQSILAAWRATRNLVQSAYRSHRAIHAEYRKHAWPACQVGVAHHLMVTAPSDPHSAADRRAARRRKFFNNDYFLRLLMGRPDDWLVILAGCSGKGRAIDFIGVNYYTREIIRARRDGRWWERGIGNVDREHPDYLNGEKNDLGWAVYPEGLEQVLIEAHRAYRLPLMVTENGICTHDESQRIRFIRNHLRSVRRAMAQGARVLGYIHWALIDNFEWSIGYSPKFGLASVAPGSLDRHPKAAAAGYAAICRSNRLDGPEGSGGPPAGRA